MLPGFLRQNHTAGVFGRNTVIEIPPLLVHVTANTRKENVTKQLRLPDLC